MKRFQCASAAVFFAFACLSLTGCGAFSSLSSPFGVSSAIPVPSAAAAVSGSETPDKPLVRKPRRGNADHRVLVMLGPGYSGRPEALEPLLSEYGLAGSGGMVEALSYPESFTVDKRIRLNVLSERAKEPGTTVLLTVGAPEGTLHELNKIRTAHPLMKIVSMFPLDDSLPVEAVSDILLDFKASGEMMADENAPAGPALSDSGLGVLLLSGALAADSRDAEASPIEILSGSFEQARILSKQKRAAAGWTLACFTDTDTGLRSRNHLILELPLQTVSTASSPAAQPVPGEGASL